MTPSHLLWLDIESTGTDPAYDAVLEIGAVITAWEPTLTELARASMVLRPPGALADHDRLWAGMHPVVRDMHTVNGLWEEATTSTDAWSIGDADTAISGWVRQHAGEGAIAVAGSGVGHLDLPFIKAQLPRLATQLLYWPLDIGGTRRMLDLAGRSDLVDLATDVDAKPHRALGDVELHVAEARRYLGLLQQIPIPGAVSLGQAVPVAAQGAGLFDAPPAGGDLFPSGQPSS